MVRMPGECDGHGLARWIAENRPGIPVILTTGNIGKDFFADARLNSHQLLPLLGSDINEVALPLVLTAQPNWLVPTNTNSFIVAAQATVPIVMENGKSIEFSGPADITHETTDAIVNAANSSLLGGGGVDGAIHRAGGPAILAECRQIVGKIRSLPAGKAVITTGGRLTAKHVIHTVGPVFYGGDQGEAEKLAGCHRESIRLADEYGLQSISFPAISTGVYAFPAERAALIAVGTVVSEVAAKTGSLRRVVFCCFSEDSAEYHVAAFTELGIG